MREAFTAVAVFYGSLVIIQFVVPSNNHRVVLASALANRNNGKCRQILPSLDAFQFPIIKWKHTNTNTCAYTCRSHSIHFQCDQGPIATIIRRNRCNRCSKYNAIYTRHDKKEKKSSTHNRLQQDRDRTGAVPFHSMA